MLLESGEELRDLVLAGRYVMQALSDSADTETCSMNPSLRMRIRPPGASDALRAWYLTSGFMPAAEFSPEGSNSDSPFRETVIAHRWAALT